MSLFEISGEQTHSVEFLVEAESSERAYEIGADLVGTFRHDEWDSVETEAYVQKAGKRRPFNDELIWVGDGADGEWLTVSQYQEYLADMEKTTEQKATAHIHPDQGTLDIDSSKYTYRDQGHKDHGV